MDSSIFLIVVEVLTGTGLFRFIAAVMAMDCLEGCVLRWTSYEVVQGTGDKRDNRDGN